MKRAFDRRKLESCWLVEDNPEVASARPGLLEQLGYRCVGCWTPRRALKEIERTALMLVFSDIVMPGRLDGLGLARIIKQKRPSLPILLATGLQRGRAERGGGFSSAEALSDALR